MKNQFENKINKIAHIAIAVKKLEEIQSWEKILEVEKKISYFSKEQNVNVIVLETKGFTLEFLCPLSDDSPISKFLDKNPQGGIHHICFKIKSIQETLEHLKEIKVRSITRNKNTKGINKKRICFLNPNDLNNILVELEEN